MRRLVPLLLILPLLTPAGRAEAQRPEDYDYENLAFSGIGAFLFGVAPARSEPALALHLRTDLGELGPQVRIVPSLTFWSTSLRQSELSRMAGRIEAACERSGNPCPGIELGEVRLSDLSLDVDAHYLWTTDIGIEPYAGAGVGVHLVNGRGDFIDNTFVEDVLDAITPGVNLMGGVELALSRNLRIHGEARAVLASNARWLGVGLGAMWIFPASLRPQPARQP